MSDVVDVLAAAAQEDEKLLARIGEVVDLQGLEQHSGWKVLEEHFKTQAKTYGHAITARWIAGEAVDQRLVDYMRGAVDMARVMFAYPGSTIRSLERTAERLYMESLVKEVQRDDELDSPFLEEVT